MTKRNSLQRVLPLLFVLPFIFISSPAQAALISDSYQGSDGHGWGDVIGDASQFDIQSMQVAVSGSQLSVSIFTHFAGKGDDGLYSGFSNGQGIGYGDLFLSSSWNPVGNAPYANDDASNGTVWSYGFSLDNRWMNENDTGTGVLYSLNSGNNTADIQLSDDFMSGGIYRNGQEVAVDRVNGDVTAISNGSWTIDEANGRIDFLLDISGTSLLTGDIALHWGETCGNDVIEGIAPAPVPLPAAAWLFISGFLGLVSVAARRKK